MIDTIRFVLHDLKKHNQIYRSLMSEKKSVEVYHDMGRDYFLNREISFAAPVRHHIETIHNLESGKTKRKVSFHSRYLPSSNYKLRMVITHADNEADGFITFEFSLPKYFYGTNILQAITNPVERDFQFIMGQTDQYNYQLLKLYNRFVKYIKMFFNTEFSGCDVDYNELEIKRIDFCFNQVFKTKEDALLYLEHQSRIAKKYMRDTTRPGKYMGGLTFVSQDYSAKVYHKGTEYLQNDIKEHLKINKSGKKFIDTTLLTELSDRILRYEITFRIPKLNYLYNNRIFRSKSESFEQLKNLYNALKSLENDNKFQHEFYDEKISRIAVKYAKISINGKKENLIETLIIQAFKKSIKPTPSIIFKALRVFYKNFDSLTNSRRRFFLSLSKNDMSSYLADNDSNTNLYKTEKKVLFSSALLIECGNMLFDFMNDLKVKERDTTDHYLGLIDKHNERIERENKIAKERITDINKRIKQLSIDEPLKYFHPQNKIEKNRLGLVLIALENCELIDLRKKLNIPESTFYRYKAELKLIGYTKNTLSLNRIFDAPLDYRNYFLEVGHPSNQGRYFINRTAYKISEPLQMKPNYDFDYERKAV